MTTTNEAQVSTPSDREVQVTRAFRAPRALVYRSYTEPALLQRWLLGPPGWTMPVCEMDVRVGGKYRWRCCSARTAPTRRRTASRVGRCQPRPSVSEAPC